MEPSPAAAVTRFTDPLRTSPAPKTPGWPVSRRKGGRPGCQFAPSAAVRISLVSDESVVVQCQLIFELAGLGICANEEEQGARFPDAGGALGRQLAPRRPPWGHRRPHRPCWPRPRRERRRRPRRRRRGARTRCTR
jgi:hypothetical protein